MYRIRPHPWSDTVTGIKDKGWKLIKWKWNKYRRSHHHKWKWRAKDYRTACLKCCKKNNFNLQCCVHTKILQNTTKKVFKQTNKKYSRDSTRRNSKWNSAVWKEIIPDRNTIMMERTKNTRNNNMVANVK
jgi:hypothetical protein